MGLPLRTIAGMKRAAVAVLAILLLAGCGAGAAGAQKRVLVVSEAAGYVHASIPAAVAELERLGRADPRYEVRRLSGFAALTPAALRGADAVVFANTSGEPAFGASRRAALLRFVRAGGGILATHSAADAFARTWPAYGAVLGGRFSHHGPIRPERLVVSDRGHPATRGLPARLTITEEFYEFSDRPRRRAHVLVRRSARGDHPLVWCRTEGRGRVFYDALGHRIETWSDPRQRRLVRGGLEWVLGLARGRC